MNKMIVTVFNTEEDAYQGLDSLGELDKKRDIALYATAVVVKDITGKVHVRQAAPKGPIGISVGMLTGAMVGLLAGPVGAVGVSAAMGMSAGGLTGLLFDMGSAGVSADFLDEISEVLIPGKSAVIAEVDEEWVTPVDSKMDQFGGIVFRRARSEVIEDQLSDESAAFHEEVNEIRDELKDGNARTKAAAGKTLQSIQKRLKAIATRSEKKLDQVTGSPLPINQA